MRAQAAKALGEGKVAEAGDVFIALLEGRRAARAFLRGSGSGQVGDKKDVPAMLDMLRDNADQDGYLRHAGVMALVGSGDKDAWMAAADDPSPAVRMGVLLALRRTEDPDVARFLNDADPLLVVEAARAINDVPIDAAMPELAALVRRSGLSRPLRLSRAQRQLPPGRDEQRRGRGGVRGPAGRFGDVADRGAAVNSPTGRSRRAATG